MSRNWNFVTLLFNKTNCNWKVLSIKIQNNKTYLKIRLTNAMHIYWRYKNLDCAACNGVTADTLVWWDALWTCDYFLWVRLWRRWKTYATHFGLIWCSDQGFGTKLQWCQLSNRYLLPAPLPEQKIKCWQYQPTRTLCIRYLTINIKLRISGKSHSIAIFGAHW